MILYSTLHNIAYYCIIYNIIYYAITIHAIIYIHYNNISIMYIILYMHMIYTGVNETLIVISSK